MALNYYLADNYLKPGSSDLIAKPHRLEFIEQEKIVEIMTRAGSILKKTEILAVLDEFFEVIQEHLENGKGIRSEYLVLTPTIKGAFNDHEDKFDPKRHQTHISVALGKPLKKSADKIKVNKAGTPAFPLPHIISVVDCKSGGVDSVLTPDHFIEIIGKHLKIQDLNDPESGIFYINQENGRIKRSNQYHVNHPGRLMCLAPGLKKGSYRLEIRGLKYKKAPSLHFDKVLQVN